MKKIIIFSSVFLFILIAAALYLLFNLNNLVAGIKPKIEQVASETLGTTLAITDISTSVFPDLKLSLKGISAEAKQNGQNLSSNTPERLSIKEVNLFIDLIGLLSGKLVVSELSVVAPQISLIRDDQGIRLAGIGAKNGSANHVTPPDAAPVKSNFDLHNQQPDKTEGDVMHRPNAAASGVVTKLPLTLALEGLRIDSGSLKVFDRLQTSDAKRPFEIQDFNLITSASFKDGIVSLKGLDSGLTVFATQKLGLSCKDLFFDINTRGMQLVKPMTLTIVDEHLTMSGDLNLSELRGQMAVSSNGIALENLSGMIQGVGDLLGEPKLASLTLKGQLKPQLSIVLNGVNQEPSFSGQIGLGGVGFSMSNSNEISNSSLHDLTTVLEVEGTSRAFKLRAPSINLAVASSGFRAGLPVKLELTKLSAETSLSPLGANIELPQILVTADNQQVKLGATINLKDQLLRVKNLNFAGFSGSLVGDLELNTVTKSFANKTQASKINLGDLLKFVIGNSASIAGELSYLTSNLSGRLGPDLLQTLQGGAEVGLGHLSIKGFNLLREVLSELKSLPFISGALLGKVPAELQASVNSDSTPLDEVMLRVNLQAGRGEIRTLTAKSLLFQLSGEGEMNLVNNRLKLQTDFAIKPPMSIGLAEKVKELKPLLNEQQLLVFPLRIEGAPPKLVVYPDLSKLLDKIGRKLLEQKGQKLLKGLLGF